MSWITPPQGGATYDGTLPELDPIEVVLKSVVVAPDEKFGSGPRAALVWETIEHEQQQIFDWASVKLGKNNSGQVSKMRSIINAIEGRPTDAEIAGIDDETLEYALDGSAIDGAVKAGVRVVVRGENVTKDANGEPLTFFRVKHYKPVQKPVPAASTNGKPTGKPTATRAAGRPVAASDF